jgi:hypothetical protein
VNQRQENVLGIAGLIVAAICAYQGSDTGDWLYEFVAPVAIIAALVIYRLRTPSPPAAPNSDSARITTAVLIVIGFLAFHHARRAEDAANAASSAIDNVSTAIDGVADAVEDLQLR